MFEREPTSDELAAMARALGIEFSRERLAIVLSEVLRLWAQARLLGALPLDEPPAPDAPGAGPSRP